MSVKLKIVFGIFSKVMNKKAIGLVTSAIFLFGIIVLALIPVVSSANAISSASLELVAIKNKAQTVDLPIPNILEVEEGDHHAIIYWNTREEIYQDEYDTDKQLGVYSYRVEWGIQGEGFPHSEVTPYRLFLMQPLEPEIIYEARVSHLDAYGNLSAPSAPIQFRHDPSKVDAQRARLNGFFDDFNQPSGAFDELKWNMAFSGCVEAGQGGHHINHEYHAHTISKSDGCDRAVTNARPREIFDFTDRTGVIEFDLDGSKRTRQLWYLDLYPAGPNYEAGRKRDISGHVALETHEEIYADPAYLLRFVQEGDNGQTMSIKFVDGQGQIRDLASFTDVYRNDACGNDMRFCNGENLTTVPNVRRHFRIEMSRTELRMFVNDKLLLDTSLAPIHESGGLPYERVHPVWLLFSYNTTKENIHRAMLHWDNFGFDAPAGYEKSTVVHNYTDGKVGPSAPEEANDQWGGPKAHLDEPLITTIPIPDQILDTAGVPPQAELMFTLQGTYSWPEEEQFIVLNEGTAQEKKYTLSKPTTLIADLPFDRIVGAVVPHSVVLPVDVASLENPGGLVQGDNKVTFYFNNISVFNIHVELTYPIANAPAYTQPAEIFENYGASNMPSSGPVGPNISFSEIAGEQTWQRDLFSSEINREGEPIRFTMINPVSGNVPIIVKANVDAQMTANGHTTGIERYELLVDQQPVSTIYVNEESPIAYFTHELNWDTTTAPDGMYELFIKAYDPENNSSYFDVFQADSQLDEYLPFEITVQNGNTPVTISSQVSFTSRGEAGSDQWIEPLEIKLTKPGSSVANYHFETITNEFGDYTLPQGRGILPGEYDIWVKGDRTLASRQRVTIIAGQNNLPSITLVEGDADHDNFVTLLDFSIWAVAYDTCRTAELYNQQADFDNDGCITNADLALLSANFGKSGATYTDETDLLPSFAQKVKDQSFICALPSNSSLLISDAQKSEEGVSNIRSIMANNPAFIAIEPSARTIAEGERFTVRINVQTGSDPIDGVAAYLDFDPNVLRLEQIKDLERFPFILQNTFDNQNGKLEFAAGTTQDDLLTGAFEFVELEFTALQYVQNTGLLFNSTKPRQTDITFRAMSVLGGISNGTITIGSETVPVPTTVPPTNYLYLPVLIR